MVEQEQALIYNQMFKGVPTSIYGWFWESKCVAVSIVIKNQHL